MIHNGQKIKVMVVDDSLVFRNFLIDNISKDPRFEVVGSAVSAEDAWAKLPAMKPDVMTLDIEMPGMSGMDFLKKMLPAYPIPVILVSSLSLYVFDALAAGAVDYVKKPDMSYAKYRDSFGQIINSKILVASFAKVHIPPSLQPKTTEELKWSYVPKNTSGHYPGEDKIIAIGASTGGTEAILDVVRNFPKNMPGVVVTQHMPAGFTQMYAERLNRICKMEVREAKNGDQIHQGLILIAPGGYQMRVLRMGSGYKVSCTVEEKVNGHAPSVDVLFNSVATAIQDKAIGVILTGMGADGAAGLLRMRQNGAYTIGQDQETSVVYGMPMEAYKLGAVCKQAPLLSIPGIIYNQLGIH